MEGNLPAKVVAMSVPGQPDTIFDRLDQEWSRTARTRAMRFEVEAWAAAEPVLAGCVNAASLVAMATWEGYRPSPSGALVLSALLRQATGSLAPRALLQALLPRIRAERVAKAMYGHGIGERWQCPADTAADLVGECFVAIKRHAGEDRDDVARVVLAEATRRLRTGRQAQHRYHAQTVAISPDHGNCSPSDLSAARSEAEWLAVAVVDALRCGLLDAGEARLVYATRVNGFPASEVGRCEGMQPRAVYYALARAERALLATAA